MLWLTPRRVMGAALLLIAVSALFPPWEAHNGILVAQCGFAPVWVGQPSRCNWLGEPKVAWTQLLLEWLFVGAVAGGLVALRTEKRRDS
jgi:hypothetical protein